MGITVNESYTLNNGITVDSYYAALENESVVIHKNKKMPRLYYTDDTPPQLVEIQEYEYYLNGTFVLWSSKESKNNKKRSIDVKVISVKLSEPPTTNVYNLIYSKFKESLTDFQDDP